MPPISRGLLSLLICTALIAYGTLVSADEEVASSTVTPDTDSKDSLVESMNVDCNHQEMVVTFRTFHSFHGMVYPRGLSKDSPCLREYETFYGDSIVYKVPLRSCNTMFIETDDGGVEYFNTIIVQPHRKLVTDQGRGYHVRCTYQNRDRTIIAGFNISFPLKLKRTGDLSINIHVKDTVKDFLFSNPTVEEAATFTSTPKHGIPYIINFPFPSAYANECYIGDAHTQTNAPLPVTTLHIYSGNPEVHVAAESVKIGDSLTLVVSLEEQETFGMKITDCTVRDGIGWNEQQLYNNEGCPVDFELMGPLQYNSNFTKASVNFQAHKFPYTPSVYYQCNVRLCIRNGGCSDMPPICDENGNNLRRKRRDVSGPFAEYRISDPEFAENATIEVFGGFYVTDTIDSKDTRLFTGEPVEEPDDGQLCISPRDFAIGIAVAGLILMIAIILAVLFLCARRRRKHVSSTTGSSVYSGPYTNTAYSHSS